ncbi:DNA alkylation repair protein [Odoribacter sp. OttesenSCG-928-L07]|nr:DNA alkylation repair protein [Odoribacter sp. OttesenSCG-928-L07]MDL2238612.1 DNA alkylation repair protein [Bacteroidales bacterium OttesenSCG-928-L14]MDL2240510.1 DNA alkylation repair protein [Bacteroidales bacterium OttesenSCG-928-K22]
MTILELRKQLFEYADEEYREFHKNLVPGNNEFIGVRIPQLRKLAKEIAKNEYEWHELVTDKTETKYVEELSFVGYVIAYAQMDNEERFKLLDDYVPRINNWATCDTFCGTLKFVDKKENNKLMWDFIQKFLVSDNEFEIRFGVVMILGYFVNVEYIDSAFQWFNKINHDGYYVKMGIAWTVAEFYIKHPEKTFKFLKDNKMDNFTHNKSIQKINESFRVEKDKKEELKKLKRKNK